VTFQSEFWRLDQGCGAFDDSGIHGLVRNVKMDWCDINCWTSMRLVHTHCPRIIHQPSLNPIIWDKASGSYSTCRWCPSLN